MRVGSMEFGEVWVVDFEFSAPAGDRPHPICLVAWELESGRKFRLWEDELHQLKHPPYPIAQDVLFVAYYASAEIGCHISLEWPAPPRVLDLFTEFRNQTNGNPPPCGYGLLGALVAHGIESIEVSEKEEMRKLAIRGGPWSDEERIALLDYCESDVTALVRLLPRMLPGLDIARALQRGRFMAAAARIEHTGIPIDIAALMTLQANWPRIQDRLIQRVDSEYGVYDSRSFRVDRFAAYLASSGIPWPRLQSGNLALDDDTFTEMSKAYPALAPLRELRYALSQMRLADLAVGRDGRNRCLLSAFRATTGRNQPSTSRFIFGPAVWLRGLIRPELGGAVAYVDWAQQEFGIAAALSGDPFMISAYESGDPYLAFAKRAGAIPPEGTKESHPTLREQYKQCVLAVQYGMGAESLALRIACTVAEARNLLRAHHETFPQFWRWSDAAVDYAMLHGRLHTVFGWNIHAGSHANARSLRNFPMQANGAEMLRLACCLATERGIRVCAPVHDAILIEAPLDGLEAAVEAAQAAMGDASEVVLGGFRLRSEAKLVRYPDRYMDERGVRMWETVQDILRELDHAGEPVHPCTGSRCASATLPVHPCTPALSTHICSYVSSLSSSSNK